MKKNQRASPKRRTSPQTTRSRRVATTARSPVSLKVAKKHSRRHSSALSRPLASPSPPPHTLSSPAQTSQRQLHTSDSQKPPLLLICDIQEPFRATVSGFDRILTSTELLCHAAKTLKWDILVTEQRPFGPTVHELRRILYPDTVSKLDEQINEQISIKEEQINTGIASKIPPLPYIDTSNEYNVYQATKSHFSMAELEHHEHAPHSSKLPPITLDNRDIIIAGVEAHVCVRQTVEDILSRYHTTENGHKKQYNIYIPADAISSQRSYDREIALQGMSHAGAVLTTAESVVYKMLHTAKHEHFKTLLPYIKEHASYIKELERLAGDQCVFKMKSAPLY